MRASARSPEHGELSDSECVSYREDVIDDVGYPSKFLSVRSPIARSVEGNQSHTKSVQHHGTWKGADSATRSPVHQEDRVTGGVP